MCHPSNQQSNEVWAYPQMQLIRQSTDENLLIEAFKIMLRHGLDLAYHSIDYDKTLLMTTISSGFTGLADLFLRNGADLVPVIFSSQEEVPATTFAASKGNISVCQLFLDHNLLKIDMYGSHCNPVCAAAGNGHKDLFAFLIENSVQLFKCPIHPNILISSPEILEMALSEEYEVAFDFPIDMMYEAAQFYTIKLQEETAITITKFLLKKDILNKEKSLLDGKSNSKMPVVGNDLHKPLILLAAERNCSKVLKYLIENSFDINAEDRDGWTALISASSYGHTHLLSYLCEHGALINKRDNRSRTALHQAAQNGHKQMAGDLIHLGAALSPVGIGGLTPLDLAEINKWDEVVDLLKQFGANRGPRLKKLCHIF